MHFFIDFFKYNFVLIDNSFNNMFLKINLRNNNIFAQIHYIPVHTLPYYQKIGYEKADLSNSENYYSKCISVPMYPSLTDEEQEFVIEKVLNYIN